MSFEAVAWVRKRGSARDFEQKWMTVRTDNREHAIRGFHALGYELRGMTIVTQAEATDIAERL